MYSVSYVTIMYFRYESRPERLSVLVRIELVSPSVIHKNKIKVDRLRTAARHQFVDFVASVDFVGMAAYLRYFTDDAEQLLSNHQEGRGENENLTVASAVPSPRPLGARNTA